MARCARALFGQTLDDIEYIFIDDCTPDRSIEVMRGVLEEFPGRKERTTVFRMPRNSGQAAVRMQGISLARGEYVIHCDSDDYPDINAYELLYGKAKAEDLDLVTCDYTEERDGIPAVQVPGACTSLARLLEGKERFALFCKMTRRTLYEDIDAPVADMGEDMVISAQLILRARRTGHIGQSLYHYCLRNDSITNKKGNEALTARWEALVKNARFLVGVLEDKYGYSGNEPEIIHFKYKCITLIRPLVHLPGYYRRWRQTFPEVDRKVLFLPNCPLEEKFWFLTIHLRLYRPIKCLTGWLRNRHP